MSLRVKGYSCLRCGACLAAAVTIGAAGCPACPSAAPANLFPIVPVDLSGPVNMKHWNEGRRTSLWRFADALPISAEAAVTLGEGLTPMLRAERIGRDLGVPGLFIKDEGRNPTWSHKDRFSTVFMSYARLSGARTVATASSGNAGASLAAYAAAAGIHCIVSTFASTAGAMVAQTRHYGATVIPFERKQDRWSFLAEGARRHGWLVASPYRAPVVGSHPIGIAGYKTLAYEIVEQMEEPPDWCILPVCYGDALIGLWQGFKDLQQAGHLARLPRLAAAEIYGSLGRAMETGSQYPVECSMPFETLAVSMGTPQSTFQALHALRASRGAAAAVSNDDLLDLQSRLARQEGLFVELTSVAPLVALQKLRRQGTIAAGDRVVAIATASGLKDIDRSSAGRFEHIPPFSTIEGALDHVADHQC